MRYYACFYLRGEDKKFSHYGTFSFSAESRDEAQSRLIAGRFDWLETMVKQQWSTKKFAGSIKEIRLGVYPYEDKKQMQASQLQFIGHLDY